MLLSRGRRVALIYVLAALIYVSPMLSTRASGDWGFVSIWDDRENFVENGLLQRAASLQTLYDMFTMVKIDVYEPLGWMLKFAVVKAVGLDAWWVRMVSIVIHVGAAVVLAKASGLVLDVDYMLEELKRPRSTGLELRARKKQSQLHFQACCVSAAVFMVHPLHVEVVGWPSAQPYTLAALFSYWALLVHVESIHQSLNKLLGGNIEESAIKETNILQRVLMGEGTLASSFLPSGTDAFFMASSSKKTHQHLGVLFPSVVSLRDAVKERKPTLTRGLLPPRRLGVVALEPTAKNDHAEADRQLCGQEAASHRLPAGFRRGHSFRQC
jgi:hypothetical protein